MGSKTDASHHTQRIIGKSDSGLQGSGNDAILNVSQTIERIHKFAKTALIQADGHRIDGKIATVLVVLKSTVFDNGFTGIVAVALLTSTHELYFNLLSFLVKFHLRRTEILKYGKVSLSA